MLETRRLGCSCEVGTNKTHMADSENTQAMIQRKYQFSAQDIQNRQAETGLTRSAPSYSDANYCRDRVARARPHVALPRYGSARRQTRRLFPQTPGKSPRPKNFRFLPARLTGLAKPETRALRQTVRHASDPLMLLAERVKTHARIRTGCGRRTQACQSYTTPR
jgi:hypothetical protein